MGRSPLCQICNRKQYWGNVMGQVQGEGSNYGWITLRKGEFSSLKTVLEVDNISLSSKSICAKINCFSMVYYFHLFHLALSPFGNILMCILEWGLNSIAKLWFRQRHLFLKSDVAPPCVEDIVILDIIICSWECHDIWLTGILQKGYAKWTAHSGPQSHIFIPGISVQLSSGTTALMCRVDTFVCYVQS